MCCKKTNTYQAYTRNKLIAEAFYLTGDIEKYGSGFMRIRQELEQYPTMKLICKEIPNGFLATLTYTKQKISVNTLSKVGDKVGDGLSDNQIKILFLIEENPKISATALAKQVGISPRKIEENIKKLKVLQKLIRVGSNKSGHWEVLKN